ncbi:S8/S53 family peptidase [Paenibacillus sp. RRE4]|uniref:S8/S53 family peptidase n=1 Tax=Paenibacillus sp. RRE4 TaxID=2962587 RepID=UPI002880D666|nr:S8/S53 family peptidase [Paenibacillus sp. RRE4]MDT0124105.1 S8/S53 family peptidase [Paenibacillus sp. RRE4]
MTIENKIPDPTWARLGFPEPPEFQTSGQHVGVIIMDQIRPHPAIRHLGDRLKYITVNHDLSVQCKDDIAVQSGSSAFSGGEDAELGVHGLKTLLALSHEPFEINGETHIGISPAAHFIVLDHGAFIDGEGERLKVGVDWILEQQGWNIRIILCTGWHASDNLVLLKRSHEYSAVQALQSAVKQEILVVCSNGNTRLGNIMPPMDYFTVGGYHDRGTKNRHMHVPYPDEPFGRNGDGHFRPDILAPRLHLTVPFCESTTTVGEVSYYGGTSGAATLIAGVAAYLFSKYSKLDEVELRSVLVRNAVLVVDHENSAPRIHVGRAIYALNSSLQTKEKNYHASRIKSDHLKSAIITMDEIERGVEFSRSIQQGELSRMELWTHSTDPCSIIRKIAVHALGKPKDSEERGMFWELLCKEQEGGVRGWYAYGLLQDSDELEVFFWIPYAIDSNWAVRWSVSEYLSRYEGRFPQLEKTDVPEQIQEKAEHLLQWMYLQQ